MLTAIRVRSIPRASPVMLKRMALLAFACSAFIGCSGQHGLQSVPSPAPTGLTMTMSGSTSGTVLPSQPVVGAGGRGNFCYTRIGFGKTQDWWGQGWGNGNGATWHVHVDAFKYKGDGNYQYPSLLYLAKVEGSNDPMSHLLDWTQSPGPNLYASGEGFAIAIYTDGRSARFAGDVTNDSNAKIHVTGEIGCPPGPIPVVIASQAA